jgi:hypothetical protein
MRRADGVPLCALLVAAGFEENDLDDDGDEDDEVDELELENWTQKVKNWWDFGADGEYMLRGKLSRQPSSMLHAHAFKLPSPHCVSHFNRLRHRLAACIIMPTCQPVDLALQRRTSWRAHRKSTKGACHGLRCQRRTSSWGRIWCTLDICAASVQPLQLSCTVFVYILTAVVVRALR